MRQANKFAKSNDVCNFNNKGTKDNDYSQSFKLAKESLIISKLEMRMDKMKKKKKLKAKQEAEINEEMPVEEGDEEMNRQLPNDSLRKNLPLTMNFNPQSDVTSPLIANDNSDFRNQNKNKAVKFNYDSNLRVVKESNQKSNKTFKTYNDHNDKKITDFTNSNNQEKKCSPGNNTGYNMEYKIEEYNNLNDNDCKELDSKSNFSHQDFIDRSLISPLKKNNCKTQRPSLHEEKAYDNNCHNLNEKDNKVKVIPLNTFIIANGDENISNKDTDSKKKRNASKKSKKECSNKTNDQSSNTDSTNNNNCHKSNNNNSDQNLTKLFNSTITSATYISINNNSNKNINSNNNCSNSNNNAKNDINDNHNNINKSKFANNSSNNNNKNNNNNLSNVNKNDQNDLNCKNSNNSKNNSNDSKNSNDKNNNIKYPNSNINRKSYSNINNILKQNDDDKINISNDKQAICNINKKTQMVKKKSGGCFSFLCS